jgi:hypothetical protein
LRGLRAQRGDGGERSEEAGGKGESLHASIVSRIRRKCRERLGGLLKFYNREAAWTDRVVAHDGDARRAEYEAKASEEIVTDVRERLRALLDSRHR